MSTVSAPFQNIGNEWAKVSDPPRPLAKEDFNKWLMLPPDRAWFKECKAYVEQRNLAGFDEIWKSLGTDISEVVNKLGPDRGRIAEAHLYCVSAALYAVNKQAKEFLKAAWEAIWLYEDARENVEVDGDGEKKYNLVQPLCGPLDWAKLADDCPNLPQRWLDQPQIMVDAGFKLLGNQEVKRSPRWKQYLAEAWELTLGLLDTPRLASDRLQMPVLLVGTRRQGNSLIKDGFVATLTAEFIPDGFGVLYPAPELAFVSRDNERNASVSAATTFRGGEEEVGKYVEDILRKKKADVRWSLSRQDQQALSLLLVGPSMSAALALAVEVLHARA